MPVTYRTRRPYFQLDRSEHRRLPARFNDSTAESLSPATDVSALDQAQQQEAAPSGRASTRHFGRTAKSRQRSPFRVTLARMAVSRRLHKTPPARKTDNVPITFSFTRPKSELNDTAGRH